MAHMTDIAARRRVMDGLRRYLGLQESLLGALKGQLDVSVLSSALWTSPPTGEVRLGEEVWAYRRHGGGVAFRERASGREVDVHTRVDDPAYFDSWRLRSYLGSMRRTGVKLVEAAIGRTGLPLLRGIEILLEDLLASRDVSADDDGFRMTPSRGVDSQ